MLISEKTTKRIDNLGRITLPKGARERMGMGPDVDLEVLSGEIDGRKCIVLAMPLEEGEDVKMAIELLEKNGYTVSRN